MKSSQILREAARLVEAGHWGLFTALRVAQPALPLDKEKELIRAILPPPNKKSGLYGTAPIDISQDHRATILCLAAAIAESEGD